MHIKVLTIKSNEILFRNIIINNNNNNKILISHQILTL